MSRVILLTFFLTTTASAQPSDAPAYTWSATGPLLVARQGACAAPLGDGRILVAGGVGFTGALRSTEIYQTDGSFVPGPDMLRARSGQTCTTLSDGRILIAGGQGDGPPVQAEAFDPATNTWTAAANGTERWKHSATLLPDGRVLLAGGETSAGPTDLLEWFEPVTNRVRSLPASLLAPRTLHASALLPDGSVLVSGGFDGETLLDSADLVKLDGIVAPAAAMPAPRAGHTATALNTGCVLIAGGLSSDGDLKSAALYCPDTAVFRSAGDMSVARYGHLAFVLPANGKVLITGGFSQGEATAASELYDPDAKSFVNAGALTKARLGIAGAADPATGSVLAVGGYTDDGPIAGCGILRGPSVTFDKARYVGGDAVTVTGLGWTANEKVTLKLSTTLFVSSLSTNNLAQISIQNFQTTASSLGRIQQTLFTASTQTAGATFTVAATGVTSGLTASSSARQIARTTTSLTANPLISLARQPVVLQATVTPATILDALDGTVVFQVASGTLLGSVSSTGSFNTGSITTTIIDGSSNTISLGESASGFTRSASGAGIFQLSTKDLPVSPTVLTLGAPPANIIASYTPSVSLYAPSSGTVTPSVSKRTVNVSFVREAASRTQPVVGDAVQRSLVVIPPQTPLADVSPTGNAHFTVSGGPSLTVPVSALSLSPGSQAQVSLMLPAGTWNIAGSYDGDGVYLAGVAPGSSIIIGKGTPSFALIPGKASYSVGEQITLTGRIQHPRVVGATPAGAITRTAGPTQFQGATVGTDPKNTGIIDTNLPVTGFPAPGNYALTMNYSGDANFLPVSAGTILTVSKAVPLITVIPPTQIVAGQQATFAVRATPPSGLASPPAVSGTITLTGVANGGTGALVAGTSALGTIRQTFPTAGTFTIAVQYNGDTNYQATTSPTVQVVVQ